MLGNDAILTAYQINAHYNTHAREGHSTISISHKINDSLKEAV